MSTAVSNTSPLVAFSAIGRLDLLRNAFDEILVPAAVRDELFPPGTIWTNAQAAQQAITQGTWLRVISHQIQPAPHLSRRVGLGEAAAIALALEYRAPLVIDDLEAREEARALGLQIVGTLGIIARNKRLGTVAEAMPVVCLLQDAGIYYSRALIHQFLTELGEAT